MNLFTRWQFGAQCTHQTYRSGQRSITPPLAHDVCVQPLPEQRGAWLFPKAPVLDTTVERVSRVQGSAEVWSLGWVNYASYIRESLVKGVSSFNLFVHNFMQQSKM